jgi:hypothetical protein
VIRAVPYRGSELLGRNVLLSGIAFGFTFSVGLSIASDKLKKVTPKIGNITFVNKTYPKAIKLVDRYQKMKHIYQKVFTFA